MYSHSRIKRVWGHFDRSQTSQPASSPARRCGDSDHEGATESSRGKCSDTNCTSCVSAGQRKRRQSFRRDSGTAVSNPTGASSTSASTAMSLTQAALPYPHPLAPSSTHTSPPYSPTHHQQLHYTWSQHKSPRSSAQDLPEQCRYHYQDNFSRHNAVPTSHPIAHSSTEQKLLGRPEELEVPADLPFLRMKNAMMAQQQLSTTTEHFARSNRREDSCIGLRIVGDSCVDDKHQHSETFGRTVSPPTVTHKQMPNVHKEDSLDAKKEFESNTKGCILQPDVVDVAQPQRAEHILKADSSHLEREAPDTRPTSLPEGAVDIDSTLSRVDEMSTVLPGRPDRKTHSSNSGRLASAAGSKAGCSAERSTKTARVIENKVPDSNKTNTAVEPVAASPIPGTAKKDLLMRVEVCDAEKETSILHGAYKGRGAQDMIRPTVSSTDSVNHQIVSDAGILNTTECRENLVFEETVYDSDQISEQCHVHVDTALNSAMSVVKSLLLQELMDCISPYAVDASDETINSSSGSAGSASISTGVSSAIHSQKSSKRKRSQGGGRDPSDEDGEDSDDDDSPRRKADGDLFSRLPLPRMKLKCPFYQRQPEKYKKVGSCRNPGFTDMAKLKEHIKRVHTRPLLQCSRCWEEFRCVEAKDKHLQADVRCEYVPEPHDDRIRPELVKEKLDFKKKPYSNAGSVEEKWKLMFKALFGDQSDVPSPYEQHGISPQLEQAICEALQEELTHELANFIEPIRTNIKGRLPAIIEGCRKKIRKLSSSSNDEVVVTPSVGSSDRRSKEYSYESSTKKDRPRNDSATSNSSRPALDTSSSSHKGGTHQQRELESAPHPTELHPNHEALKTQHQDISDYRRLSVPNQHSLNHHYQDWGQSQANNRTVTLEHRPPADVSSEPQAKLPEFTPVIPLVPGAYTRDAVFEPRIVEESLLHNRPVSFAECSLSSWEVNELGLTGVNTKQADVEVAEIDGGYFTNAFDLHWENYPALDEL